LVSKSSSIWSKKSTFISSKSSKDLAFKINVSQPKHGSFGQFLEIITSWFKFQIPSWCLYRLVKIIVTKKICFVSIWIPTIPKISKYPTIGNCVSCAFHHLNGFSQDFATNCKFWKHASSHYTYNQRQIVSITYFDFKMFY
jgi:hypothetical protein